MNTTPYTTIVEAHEQRGFAVLPLLSRDECAALIDQIWDWIESLGTGTRRGDPATWGKQWPGHVHGIFKNHGVGQAPFMWRLRTDPRVLGVFAYLWQTTARELLCSFDGCSVMRPRSHWRCKWALEGRLHVDVSLERDVDRRKRLSAQSRLNTPCVQGLIALADMDESTGTFACVPGSHKRFRNRAEPPSDWYRLNKADLAAVGEPVRLRVPAGAMVLWDSRTTHCGAKPMPADKLPERPGVDPSVRWASQRGDGFRYVSYVSYLPRRFATERERARRRKAFTEGRTTGHWAYPMLLNQKRLRYDTRQYNVQLPELERVLEPSRVTLARRLIGFDDAPSRAKAS